MEQNIGRLNNRWVLLRTLGVSQAIATTLLILATIPQSWWGIVAPAIACGMMATILTVLQLRKVWASLTLLAEGFLFATAMAAAILGITGESYVPLLLLAFTMVIATEHALDLILKLARQFSKPQNQSIIAFNFNALETSLDNLFRKLTWDGFVFGIGFLLSVSIASLGAAGQIAGVLSDPSLYAVVAALSVAMLILLKGE